MSLDTPASTCAPKPPSLVLPCCAAGWLLRRAAHTPGLDERLKLGGDALCSHCCTDASTGRTVFLRYRLKLQRRPGDLYEQQASAGRE